VAEDPFRRTENANPKFVRAISYVLPLTARGESRITSYLLPSMKCS
jgi:hypothetical protein